ncbi:MAG: hypothetical protein ACNI3C_06960 [Candidatus Marinarcus sp.]|uniref:hypothetical protein n=1 Tax=Candidatus Marinarcus sp. TaxID=3100987 RepID=UPI003AFF97D1
MRKASFNYQGMKHHSYKHNFRKSKVNYLLIHDDSVNEYYNSKVDLDKYLDKAKTLGKELTNRSMQQKAIDNFYQEAVINLLSHHTIEDVKQLFKNLQEQFNTKAFEPLQISVHKDEGVYLKFLDNNLDINHLWHDATNLKFYDTRTYEDVSDKIISYAPARDIYYDDVTKKFYEDEAFTKEFNTTDKETYINYHAHVVFSKFDPTKGKNVRLCKSDLSTIQDITANSLIMRRGQKGQNKRLNHWQLKQAIDINKQKQEDLQAKLQEETKIKNNYENSLNKVADILQYEGEDIDKLIEETKKLKQAYQSTLEQLNTIDTIIVTKAKVPKEINTLDKKIAYIVQENNWFKSKFMELVNILNIEVKSFTEIFEKVREKLSSKGKNIFSKLIEDTKELNKKILVEPRVNEKVDLDFSFKKDNVVKKEPFKRKKNKNDSL